MERPFWIEIPGAGINGLTAQMAWNHIWDYANAAQTQLKRIAVSNLLASAPEQTWHSAAADLGLTPEEYVRVRSDHDTQATADAHFYLNCWRIIALNALRIALAIKDPRLDRFLKDQQCPVKITRFGETLAFGKAKQSLTLGWYAQGRDHFEHIDERILGGTNWESIKASPDRIHARPGFEHLNRPGAENYPDPFFNGTHMIVGDSTWEITEAAHVKLLGAVQALYEIGQDLVVNGKTSVDEESKDSGLPPSDV